MSKQLPTTATHKPSTIQGHNARSYDTKSQDSDETYYSFTLRSLIFQHLTTALISLSCGMIYHHRNNESINQVEGTPQHYVKTESRMPTKSTLGYSHACTALYVTLDEINRPLPLSTIQSKLKNRMHEVSTAEEWIQAFSLCGLIGPSPSQQFINLFKNNFSSIIDDIRK